MPRTRSLAFSELKIGVADGRRPGHRRHGHLHAERRGRVLLAALPAEDALRRGARPEDRRPGPRRRHGSRHGHRHRASGPRWRSSSSCRGRCSPASRPPRSPRSDQQACSGRAPSTSPPPAGPADSRVGLRASPAGAGRSLATSPGTPRKALRRLTRLLQGVREGKGTIGRLFTDDSLYREIQRFVAAADGVAGTCSRGRARLASS